MFGRRHLFFEPGLDDLYRTICANWKPDQGIPMAILHVRNIPDKLYNRFQKLAGEANHPLTAEVIQLL